MRVYIDEFPQDDEFPRIEYGDVSGKSRAIVVGAGPAGLFAALRLIELGICPVVVERGKNVHDRRKDIALILSLIHISLMISDNIPMPYHIHHNYYIQIPHYCKKTLYSGDFLLKFADEWIKL